MATGWHDLELRSTVQLHNFSDSARKGAAVGRGDRRSQNSHLVENPSDVRGFPRLDNSYPGREAGVAKAWDPRGPQAYRKPAGRGQPSGTSY